MYQQAVEHQARTTLVLHTVYSALLTACCPCFSFIVCWHSRLGLIVLLLHRLIAHARPSCCLCVQADEKAELSSRAKGDVVASLLPLVDNFELARTQVKAETEAEQKINNSYQVRKGLVCACTQPGGRVESSPACNATGARCCFQVAPGVTLTLQRYHLCMPDHAEAASHDACLWGGFVPQGLHV